MTNESITKPLTHIQFTQIQKHYSKKGFGFFSRTKHSGVILDNADIELKGGECVLLTGKNGSGKSTLLRILAGLLKPNSAIINTGLESLSWKKANKLIRQHIMYLYQEPYMFDGTVKRNLAYAVRDGKPDYQIEQALKWANLEHRSATSAKCLSGGERQRVALAQAWLKQPSVLLLDEPTANMDEESRRLTEDLLCKFKDSGTALLIASHDVNHFHQTMDKRLLLKDGSIFEISDNTEKAHDNISLFPSSSKRKA
jgi:tungstate transport system ATP-binding protein